MITELASLPPVSLLQFFLGLAMLMLGAELSVRNLLRLAERARVRPLIAGLSLMALGSSAPQLAIGLGAINADAPDLAFGSLVGGTLFNLWVTLGLCALIVPLRVSPSVVRLDLPLVALTAVLLYGLSMDQRLGSLEAVLLVAAWAGYLCRVAWHFKHAHRPVPRAPVRQRSALAAGVRLALGILALTLGSQWILAATVAIANELGLSERIMGLTLVAVCASLPGLAMSSLAALRGERELAVGNVIGATLCNLTGVLGVVVLAAPRGLSISPNSLAFDLPVLFVAALLAWPLLRLGYRLSRLEGLLLLALYALFGAHLVAFNTDMPLAMRAERLLLHYVLPLLGILVAMEAWRNWRRSGRS
ncbi:sodium:calcium antiporter [Pseudomonas sp. DC3000-4b1]|uniref:sodium:calcium antiporter n=1 Tax=unclassified Pseudomonas TaxID=196821 RepID=UPI003CEE330F